MSNETYREGLTPGATLPFIQCPECQAIGSRGTHRVTCSQYQPAERAA